MVRAVEFSLQSSLRAVANQEMGSGFTFVKRSATFGVRLGFEFSP